MLIGIDGFETSVGQRVGVGRLAVELIRGLARVDKRNKYRVYVPNFRAQQDFGEPFGPELTAEGLSRAAEPLQPKKNWKLRSVPQTRLWSQVTLPFYLYKDKPRPDVFLTPSHYAPRFCPCPSLIFVFDLSYIYFPNMFKKRDLYKLTNWTKYSVRKAAKVITISKASKADIIREYRIESSKVKVVYPGIMKVKSQKLKVKSTSQKLKVKYGIDEEYILYVGTLQPRKNLVKLIDAFNELKAQSSKLKSATQKLKLVVVGKKGWLYENIFKKVEDLNLTHDVIFTGFVPDKELPVFYKSAKLLALVSLYEGFGLPVLEAMSYGTPVVVSNVSSLPEVAGGAGIYVDPNNTDDIAKGIRKVLKMDKKQYENLSKQCKTQAKKFSWEKTAKETLDVIKKVAGSEE
jgi:glycosyltransferase involved in cell wall biosynthesis